jgi:predicted nucleotide-binding protein (sugar kinase/HSP70/actin superfamily)
MDFVHQLIMVQNFRSLKALHMQIMTHLSQVTKLEREVQRGSEISCVEYKRISLQSDECCPLILSVISSPLHSLSPIQENWHLLPENVKP